jgi:hypothetical protein
LQSGRVIAISDRLCSARGSPDLKLHTRPLKARGTADHAIPGEKYGIFALNVSDTGEGIRAKILEVHPHQKGDHCERFCGDGTCE